MLELISASQNIPFSVALAVMLGIAFLEGVTVLLGTALSGLLDSLIPDFDVDADVDGSSVDLHSHSTLSKLLGWLRIGQVPALVLLVIFLTGFGLIGLSVQSVVHDLTGLYLPSYVAAIPALGLALPIVRVFGGFLGRILPKDETEAVSVTSFIGRVATITLGTAKKGSPAEAKVKDRFGYSHYIMVEPDVENSEFSAQTVILLVKKEGHIFKAIKNENQSLVDQ